MFENDGVGKTQFFKVCISKAEDLLSGKVEDEDPSINKTTKKWEGKEEVVINTSAKTKKGGGHRRYIVLRISSKQIRRIKSRGKIGSTWRGQ